MTITNGGAANIFARLDLAGNAETQALRQFANHKNLRVIYTMADVAYRVVGSRKAGVAALADPRGKKIGSMPLASFKRLVDSRRVDS